MSKLKGLAGVAVAAALAWAKANGAVIGGFVRALLAAVGGWLVNEGYASEADVTAVSENAAALSGGVFLAVAVVWSWVSKIGKGAAKGEGVKNG